MPIKKFSITKAEEIVYLYAEVLSGDFTNNLQPYSALPMEDLFNSVNLVLAYDFKNQIPTDWIKTTPIINYARYFLPNDLYHELEKYPLDSKEYKVKARDFSINYFESLMKDGSLAKSESSDSILNFCISIGRENPEYWQLIYKRLGLEIDNSDYKLDIIEKESNPPKIKKGKKDNFNNYSYISIGVLFISIFVFISEKASTNLWADILKFGLVFGSYFAIQFIIDGTFVKNDKAANRFTKIIYLIGIASITAIVVFMVSRTNYDMFFEYFTIISLPSFISAINSFTKDSKMSGIERLKQRKELERFDS